MTVARRLADARADPGAVVLEGFHAVKHALRFGADVTVVAAADPAATIALAQRLAPDVVAVLTARMTPASDADLRGGGARHHTGVVAVAQRPATDPAMAIARRPDAPVVLLDDPRNLGNVGAVIRVAAAADLAGVVTTGIHDPWDPAAVRGSAGLHFALAVGRVSDPPPDRPVLGLDPGGRAFQPSELAAGAVLAFGTERDGLSPAIRARCDDLLALPMRPGVSSLNLATSVAATVFAWRLGQGWSGGGAAAQGAGS